MGISVCVYMCVCVQGVCMAKEKWRQTEEDRKWMLFSMEKLQLREVTGKVYKITKEASGGIHYIHCLNSKAR